ncbi:hypothetical protein Bca101_029570 [Brassica carinata]
MYFCVFYKCFSDLEDFLDDLPVSNLEVVWTSWKSSDKVVWTSRKSSGFNMQVFQIWKTSGTTYLLVVWKSSGLLGSLLTKSSDFCKSRLNFLEVVWTS